MAEKKGDQKTNKNTKPQKTKQLVIEGSTL